MAAYSNSIRSCFAALFGATVLLLPASSQASQIQRCFADPYWPPYQNFDAMRRDEAELLALEVSGELVAPAALRDRILSDLNAIRAEYSQVANITAQGNWNVGEVYLGLDSCLAQAVAAGDLSRFEALFATLGTPTIEPTPLFVLFDRSIWPEYPQNYVFRFDESYHPEVLSQMLAEIAGVSYAQPNHLFGLWPMNDVTVNGNCYTFTSGGWCQPYQTWTFCVTDGHVTLCPEPQSQVLGMMGMIGVGLVAVRGRRPQLFSRGGRSQMAALAPVAEQNFAGVQGDNFVTWPARRSASEVAHEAIAEQLRASEASIDVPNADGDTLLHIACRTGELMTVQALVSAGASLGTTNNSGRTPLDEAIASQHPLVVQYLREFAS